jgi:hypothetical protein
MQALLCSKTVKSSSPQRQSVAVGCKWVLTVLILLLVGCRPYPPPPHPDRMNESILEETRVVIPQFFEMYEVAFSPDRSKVAILGFHKAFDDGESYPELITGYAKSETLMILEWPSLAELYRRDVDPADYFFTQVRWSPDGRSFYVIYRQTDVIWFLERVDLATGALTRVPFTQWDYVVAPGGQQIIAWGEIFQDTTRDNMWLEKWHWTNQLFIYDATNLTLLEVVQVPEIDYVSLVYGGDQDNELLIAQCNSHPGLIPEEGRFEGRRSLSISGCDNTLYRFQRDSGNMSTLVGPSLLTHDVTMLGDDVTSYNPQRALLIAKTRCCPTEIVFVDVEAACVVLKLTEWDSPNQVRWYDHEHIFELTWPTRDNRTPEIRLYRIRELVGDNRPSCLLEN